MRRSATILVCLVAAMGTALASPSPHAPPPFSPQSIDTGVTARFRGISTPGNGVVWASGTGGTVVRTTDGGETWDAFTIAGAESLDLRDIDAFDENIAYALSIGSGADSRIFKTIDGGASWETQFVNQEPQGFFDAMAFWDSERRWTFFQRSWSRLNSRSSFSLVTSSPTVRRMIPPLFLGRISRAIFRSFARWSRPSIFRLTPTWEE